MRNGARSLRATLGVATAVITLLAVLVAAALMVLTTYLHRMTHLAGESLISVRLADQARIDLLLHERSRDALVRSSIERNLLHGLNEARGFITSPEEARALEEAGSLLNAYLAASRQREPSLSSHVEAVYAALHALVQINVEQAQQALARADRWNRAADLFGAGSAALLLLVGGGLIAWLSRQAFRPIFSLFEVMRCYAEGDRSVRAQETGHFELREMSRRFNEMATALSASRRAQLAFMGGVAHDLRNPLWALRMSVQLLNAGDDAPKAEQLRSTLESLNGQIGRLERMVDDLLDAARIEAGELELKIGPHDARLLVQSVLRLLAAPLANYRIKTVLPVHPVKIDCDALRIEQVLTNLVSNAMKYSPAGESIEVALETGTNEAIFRVTDRGIGISEENQKRVFEPFERAGLTRETPGAGLGLFVVKRIVEGHRGRITVASAPGRGSTFRVHLPVTANATASNPPVAVNR
jgi:signal transduction histidine kinase